MTEKSGNKKITAVENVSGLNTNPTEEILLSANIQDTLDFIDDFFSNYFGEDKKVPFSYLKICKKEIKQQLEILTEAFSKNEVLEKNIAGIITSNIQQFIDGKSRIISFSQISYQKELLKQLLAEATLHSLQNLRETLYFLNYNEDNFIAYEYAYLKELVEKLPTKKEKITSLRFEQKAINQFPVKLALGCSSSMLSLKQQINTWIDEEIKFLETGFFTDQNTATEPDCEDKIHTSLSVAKLALIIRLLVVDKIILNKKVAPMLRIVARSFTSLQKEGISFGSMETKYHAPEKATINAVKDMLFKWINILGRL